MSEISKQYNLALENKSVVLDDHSGIGERRTNGRKKYWFHTQYTIPSGKGVRYGAVPDGQETPAGSTIVKVFNKGDCMGNDIWLGNREKDIEEEFEIVHSHGSLNSVDGVPMKYQLTGRTRPRK